MEVTNFDRAGSHENPNETPRCLSKINCEELTSNTEKNFGIEFPEMEVAKDNLLSDQLSECPQEAVTQKREPVLETNLDEINFVSHLPKESSAKYNAQKSHVGDTNVVRKLDNVNLQTVEPNKCDNLCNQSSEIMRATIANEDNKESKQLIEVNDCDNLNTKQGTNARIESANIYNFSQSEGPKLNELRNDNELSEKNDESSVMSANKVFSEVTLQPIQVKKRAVPTDLDLVNVVNSSPNTNEIHSLPVASHKIETEKDNLENGLKEMESQIIKGVTKQEKDQNRDEQTKKEARNMADVEITPRFANFLTSTSHKALIKAANMEDTVKRLGEGSYLWKIRGVNKCYNRQYKVDKESMALVAESRKWWSPGGFTSSVASEGSENAVPIVEIVEIREGWKTDAFNKIADYNEKMKEKKLPVGSDPEIEESLCFSVIHDGGREVLDLMANSLEERELWISGLRYLKETVQSLHQDRVYDIWLRKKFETADKDKNGVLAFDEICSLITGLNLKLDKKHARTLFNGANTSTRKKDGEQVLDSKEFVDFYHSLLKMTEIENLYAKYCSKETKVMGANELLSFLCSEQGMQDYQLNQATSLIHEFELSDLKENDNLSFDGFYHLLLSDVFNIYNANHKRNVHQDMSQPLAHYFISSSHNTYLVGNQLAGESSVEGYINALKKGCRLVELDLWDGDEGEPIIYHGHTLTSKITLADVLRDAIKLYAFTASPYPVILSIENHLSIPQQVVMVKLFKQILAENLLTDPIPHDLQALPSPEDLKYKIIVKAKKPQGLEIEDDDEDDDQETIDFIDSEDGNASSKKKHQKTLAPDLAKVVNVCEGKKFVSFGTSAESDKCYHFPSLRENKAKTLLESSPDEFIKFTKRQIAKIYPLGTRTDSSNLKPYPFWSVGAQAVTLNMQTEDKAMFYNDALFKSNGNCGYVLKPNILLIDSHAYSYANPEKELKKVVKFKIISAQHLPPSEKKNDIVDPYIQMKMRGHPLDKQKQRTKTIKNNGFNPVWNETLEAQIRVPDVALIYFTVRDESTLAKDPVLALACIPFGSLCTGYRHVHLTSISGKSLSPAAIFVHVSVKDS